MRRWDILVERYLRECEIRGLASSTVEGRRAELVRWGGWLKRQRPRPRLEEIGAPAVVAYVRARRAFHAKSTVASTMSAMRGMGEFLVREGIWGSNPLRWLRGPKLDARMRVPRRIGAEQMERLWRAAARHRSAYHRQLWTAVLGVLYGTGLRRGELLRLDVSSWDRSARAGSPLAERDSHPLDGERSFMESSHPPFPFDQHCLVALSDLALAGPLLGLPAVALS